MNTAWSGCVDALIADVDAPGLMGGKIGESIEFSYAATGFPFTEGLVRRMSGPRPVWCLPGERHPCARR